MSKNTEKIPLTLQDQIKLEITNKIKSGKYLPGDKIPSEPQLVKIYNVSRVTVRNAIQQLVDENILIKRHGKGTFVKSRIYTENYLNPKK
ncbi:GntR family transcriptional regulator [Faecalicoccus pleomorphus]|uniref:GntR family transcriptional regulator n=1 Tax=Faecalicoccus pleomorphus TaxID=1323 RepID=UPI0026EFCA1B|nr:GntR family transcriptional regulator [Faecalicoccus pleomorphus]